MKRMPQLDALRAFAVLGVFTNHWLPAGVAVLPWGNLGVQLFFVLSGFLITGILLDVREKTRTAYTIGVGLRRFYARRFLRIFPLFYATLAVGWIIGLPNIRASLPWHAVYASNFYVAFVNHTPGEASHLWTLAAEEQFYLVWPCVILLLPMRFLKPLFCILIATAFAWRLIGTALRMDPFTLQALPINTVDFFAFGGFLALLHREGLPSDGRHVLFNRGLLVFAAVAFLPSAILNLAGAHVFALGGTTLDVPVQWERIVLPSAAAFLFVNAIHHASHGIGGRLGSVLEHRVLLHLGKVSYGLYLLHLPLMAAINLLLVGAGWNAMEPRSWALFVPKAVVTALVAMMSWRFFEKPLNGLKRHFPY